MRKFLLFIVALMFTANMSVVAAWAEPCMTQKTSSQPPSIQKEMPCHQPQEKQQNGKHCKGLCLCLHVAASHVIILLGAPEIAPALPPLYARIPDTEDVMSSIASAPPHKPPKYIS